MNDKQQTTETSSDEAIVIEADPLEQEAIEKTPAKTRRWPLFMLAFIVGSATSIFALNYYQQNYILKSNSAPVAITPSTEAPLESASIKPAQEVSKSVDTLTLETSMPTAISSEEGEALIAAITTLQGNIQFPIYVRIYAAAFSTFMDYEAQQSFTTNQTSLAGNKLITISYK